MHQVKLFKGIESEIDELERDINTWLKSNGAKVVNIFGNIAPQTVRPDLRPPHTLGGERIGGRAYDASDVFLAIVYET